jgi:hypothetical protein
VGEKMDKEKDYGGEERGKQGTGKKSTMKTRRVSVGFC